AEGGAEAAVLAEQGEPVPGRARPAVGKKRGGGGGVARGLPVPRAHVLAGIAAEDAVAEPGGELFGDRALVLDGPVADAPVRVEAAGRDEGVGGAGVE